MLSESDDEDEMAPDLVAAENGRESESHLPYDRYRQYLGPLNLKKESERLKTFTNWKVSFLDREKLAKGGFYYTNTGDVVQCVYCGVAIGLWKEGDDPEKQHGELMPECPMVTGKMCEEAVTSQDVCGSYGLEIRPFSGPERPRKAPFTIDSSNLCRNFEELGVSKITGPTSPYYATLNSRLKTFKNWPIPEIQAPGKMAEAGFYYTSVNDNVLCFHCGGGLKNWEVEDDPWVEHGRWFSRCGFVLLRKGKSFVRKCVNEGNSQPSEENVRETATSETSRESEKEEKKEETKKNTKEEEVVTSVTAAVPSHSNVEKEKENQESPDLERKEIELCRICYVRERGIVFLPCGHFVSCTQCAPSLSMCAVCRKPFEATVRAYLS